MAKVLLDSNFDEAVIYKISSFHDIAPNFTYSHKSYFLKYIIGTFLTKCFFTINFIAGACKECTFSFFAICEPLTKLWASKNTCTMHNNFKSFKLLRLLSYKALSKALSCQIYFEWVNIIYPFISKSCFPVCTCTQFLMETLMVAYFKESYTAHTGIWKLYSLQPRNINVLLYRHYKEITMTTTFIMLFYQVVIVISLQLHVEMLLANVSYSSALRL